MQDPRNLSWTQFNQSRRFPLVFDCDATAIGGHFRIPDDFLTGLYLSYSLSSDFTDPGGFEVGSVIYYREGITISIRYNGTIVAETSIDLSSSNDQKVFAVLGKNNRFIYGHGMIGDTSGLLQQPIGEWEFATGSAPIDPFCVRPSVEAISALYVQSGDRVLGPFYGDVKLMEGTNINLTVKSAHDTLQCLEEPLSGEGTEVVIGSSNNASASGSKAITNINGVYSDSNGGITITGRSCMEITSDAAKSSIVLDDQCAEPCCSCTELEPIETKILEMTTSLTELTEHIATLRLQTEFLLQSLTSLS